MRSTWRTEQLRNAYLHLGSGMLGRMDLGTGFSTVNMLLLLLLLFGEDVMFFHAFDGLFRYREGS